MCECRQKMDEKLKEVNGRLAAAFLITEGNALRVRYCIQTEKLDKAKRKPVPTVVASYCPFCGEEARHE
jgi:hypothetical protein